jgi:hypothetical protein
MPKKTFTAGEVLAAADVNTFLMDQSVMTFADSGARGSAIGTATEGMLTYLNDSDTYQSWNGSAWVGIGGGGAATNAIINGAFEINQRSFSSTQTNGVYGFDRFAFVTETNGVSTYSAQTFTAGTAPEAGYEGTNFARLVSASQTATTAQVRLVQPIESVRSFANQKVTLSLWAKASTGTPDFAVSFDQQFGSGGSSVVSVSGQKTAITTSWARYSFTFDIPSISGKTVGANSSLLLNIWTSAGSNYNTSTDSLGNQNVTIDIWGVQLEAGSTATAFRRNANSLQGELAACQRYYFRIQSTASGQRLGFANAESSTVADCFLAFPVIMRTTPTALETTGTAGDYSIRTGGNAFTANTVPTFQSASASLAHFQIVVASGLTNGFSGSVRAVNTNTFLGWSAEL